jgi:hypothetical protein
MLTETHGLTVFNRLNAELNPICHFLALLEARHILHISRITVKNKLLRKKKNLESDEFVTSFLTVVNQL